MTLTPTYRDILSARPVVYTHLQRTPLHEYGLLSERLGARVFVKHENHHAIRVFKARGGVYLASTLTEAERRAGLYSASTGNHGQSIAFGGRVNGTPVTIAVPEGANPSKVAAMRSLGAEVIFHGSDFDTAREWIESEAEKAGARFVSPTDPELICGVGTYAVEILEDLSDVDTIIVPVGAGSGACGVCLVAKTVNPKIEVIGVQAEKAPTQQRSWKAGRPVLELMETRAEGLATRVPFENTQRIMGHPTLGLDDFVLVSDEAMESAIRLYLETIHEVAEHAGAAALAAAIELREHLADRKVVLVLSGGNISSSELRRILA